MPSSALKESVMSHTSMMEMKKRPSSKKANHRSQQPFLVRVGAYRNFKMNLAGESKWEV